VINQIRSLTEDTLSECQKRKSALTLKVAALAGAQVDVGALTLTGAGGGSCIFHRLRRYQRRIRPRRTPTEPWKEDSQEVSLHGKLGTRFWAAFL